MRFVSARLVMTTAAAGVLLVAAIPAARAVPPTGAADPAVITEWNEIAVNTITLPAPDGGGKANAEGFLWNAFAQAAVYNAVNGITREYELYEWNAKAPKGASPQAAAAVAAHAVLMEYFGTGDFPHSATIAANLNSALATSLGRIPDGVSKMQGVRYGERAAEHIVDLRRDDGRFAPIVFSKPVAAGVWRPTPPAMAPFFDPWLGFIDPLVIESTSQFRPGPPPAIHSETYETEFAEVRDFGASPGTPGLLRTAVQTQTARFFSDIAPGRLQAGLRDLATRRGMDISDSARMFAAVDLSLADSVSAVWEAKYFYGWWRPITAIREDDGNPDTVGNPTWTPLIGTPPYPDWPSGLSGVIGALSTTLTLLNGSVDLYLTSAAADGPGPPPPPPVTRYYGTAAHIQQDVIDARVWSGIHFRMADEVGVAMGAQVASWALGHHFAPSS